MHRALLAGVALITASLAGAALAAPRVGAPAPAFVGETIGGKPLDFAALKGQVVVVNLWASWCPPCRAEMPMLDAFSVGHQARGVVLVGLSADRHRDLGDVRKAMAAFHYPAALLSDAKLNEVGVPSALPMTYVVDRAGMVRAVLINPDKPLSIDVLEAAVEQALAAGTASR